MKRTLTALALALAVVAPAFAADDAEIIAKKYWNNFAEVSNRDGPAALPAFYSKDAVILPPMTAEPIKGEANIKKFWAEQQKLDKLTVPVSSAKMLDPKTMYVTGAWGGDAPGANGAAPTHVGGTWLGVMVQDGADWKIVAGTWQIVPPPGAQPATAAAPATDSSGSTTPKK